MNYEFEFWRPSSREFADPPDHLHLSSDRPVSDVTCATDPCLQTATGEPIQGLRTGHSDRYGAESNRYQDAAAAVGWQLGE